MRLFSKALIVESVVALVAASAIWAQDSKPPQSPPPASGATPPAYKAPEKESPQQEAKEEAKEKATSMKPARSRVLVGTVSEINDTQLVLTHKAKDGKAETTTFVINPSTQKKGNLKEGVKAVVNYKVENNENVATVVRPAGVRRTASVSRTKGK